MKKISFDHIVHASSDTYVTVCICMIVYIAFASLDSVCSFVVVEHHSDLLDMKGKLDPKELQNLKLRVEGLENKNKEESSRDDTRDRRERTPIDV